MPDEKHLEKLKQGAKKWNEWRMKNPEIKVDLSESDLSNANLGDFNLSNADLNGSNLRNAEIGGASLYKINLHKADLRGVDLFHAFLSMVNLSEANLSGVNLDKADLGYSNLSEANFRGADFSDANLRNTDLSGADLSNANLSDANLSGADLSGADLSNANLNGADLNKANLHRANLSGVELNGVFDLIGANLSGIDLRNSDLFRACLSMVNLSEANLSGIDLFEADFSNSNLSKANLSGTSLIGANLRKTNLLEANLSNANLSNATLVQTNLINANLTGCKIYGISAWDLKLEGAIQSDLIITSEDPAITVDNLEVAQFIYLMLHNEKIRDVINTIGKKGVLILGRFKPAERKEVLDAIREKLRQLDYVPIVFDFERPIDRDFTETIMTLAGMCCFIIADITNPRSSPLELQAVVPNYMIPLRPILQENEEPFANFRNLIDKYGRESGWVLNILKYDSVSDLMESFKEAVIEPCLNRQKLLKARKAEELIIEHANDFIK